MIVDQIGYSYNDVTIIPEKFTEINSRSQCDPFRKGMLPIFTAPMTAVISDINYKDFMCNFINPIIPRSVDLRTRLRLAKESWIAVSLNEFKELFVENTIEDKFYYKVCIDIANGHMRQLINLCRKAKENYKYMQIMVGNIANPKTFQDFTILNARTNDDSKIIDYVRVGIGGGSGCITTSNTGIHYPMASLINECNRYKTKHSPMLIADGNIRNYSDVIKALALGADYVMIGGLFAQCMESAGDKIETETGEYFVKFYGMASADGQIAINGSKVKTAEGITKMLPVKYTLHKWVDNMIHYLKSAMSYCDSKTLDDFIGNQYLIINTANAVNSVNK